MQIRFHRPATPRLGFLELLGGIGLLALLVARFVPVARYWPLWGCPLRKLTGLPCLGCGMTRAFDWLMRGRIADSLAINPLGFVLAAGGLVAGAYLLLYRLRPPRPEVLLSSAESRWLRGTVLGLIAANWAFLLLRALAARAD